MSHELTKLHLQSLGTDLQFLQSYLGDELFEEIGRLFNISSMPAEVLGVYRKTAEFMAEILPEADHVVRDDVARNANATAAGIGGYVAIYFGVQSPAFDTRHQFVGLAYYPARPDKPWTFYIAGATVKENLQSLIAESSATQDLNGLSCRTVDEFELIKPKLEAVARFYRAAIAARKKGIDGFIPATAYQLQQTLNRSQNSRSVEIRLEQAGRTAYEYFNDWSRKLSDSEKVRLKQGFRNTDNGAYWTKFVQMIFSGYAVDQAFEISLGELNARLK